MIIVTDRSEHRPSRDCPSWLVEDLLIHHPPERTRYRKINLGRWSVDYRPIHRPEYLAWLL